MAKSKIIIIAILASLAVGCLTACSMGGIGGGSTGGHQNVDYSKTDDDAALTLSQNEKNLTIGDTFLLSPSYNKILGYTMTYSSSNPSVASINLKNGLITALNQGTATVKATYSNGIKTAEASMTVNCDFGGYLPEAKVNGVTSGDALKLNVDDEFFLDPYVSFNGIDFDDGVFTYSVADTTVATVTNGTLNAIKKGETSLIINGTWRGKTVSETVDLVVKDEVIFLNDGKPFDDVIIYTVAKTPDGKTYPNSMPNKFKIKVNGEEKSASVSIANTNLAKKNGSTIIPIAGKFGSTTVTVSTTDNVYSKTINLTVERPVITVERTVPMFATDYGYYLDSTGTPATLLSFVNDDTDLVDVYQGNKSLEVITSGEKKGYVFGIASNNSAGRSVVNVVAGTATVKYDFTVEVVAKFFKTKEDLQNLCQKAGDTASGGYYELLGNIDATGITMAHVTTTAGFKGTFNGGGYTISNLTIAEGHSFIGAILEGAKISNLGLKNLKATKAYYMYQSGIESGWTMENLYVSLTSDTQSPMGFGSYAGSGNVMKNVVVEYLGDNASAQLEYNGRYQGSFMSGLGRFNDPTVAGKYVSRGTYENVYVVSPMLLSFSSIDGFGPDQNQNRPSPAAAIYAYGDNETNDIFNNPTAKGTSSTEEPAAAGINTEYYNIIFTGVKRYDTADAFKAAMAALENSPFSSDYWTVGDDGSIAWTSANA